MANINIIPNNTPFICIDCDGVILDTNAALINYLNKRHISYNPQNLIRYDFTGDIGCDKEYCFKAFNESNFWKEELKHPLVDLKKIVNKLNNEGIVPFIYTLLDNKEAIKIRTQFLLDNNIDYFSIYDNKKPVIKEAEALFEDCLDNIKTWFDNGYTGPVYLINHNYNQEEYNNDFPYFDKVIRVNNLEEGIEIFINNRNKQKIIEEHEL